MIVQEAGRVDTIATGLIQAVEKFEAYGIEPEVQSFMAEARSLGSAFADVAEPNWDLADEALDIELALQTYEAMGIAPDFNWFAPAVRQLAVKLRDEALAALEPLVEIDDDDEGSN